MKTKDLRVRLTEQEHAKYTAIAKKLGISLAALVRLIMAERKVR